MYIIKVKFFIILLFTLFSLCCFKSCSPEYCNFAGECSLIKNKPTCSCYEEAFQGKYCETIKNLCLTERNICPTKQSCIPYVSQSICICPNRSSGYDCTISARVAHTKPMCNYNVRAVYGIKEHIVLSFEDLGSADFQINVLTSTDMIANVPRSALRGSRTAEAKHTKNLTKVVEELGIRRHIKLPYIDAHFYVFPVQYFTLGVNELTVQIKAFDIKDQIKPYTQTLSIVVRVVQPSSVHCLPHVVFQQCMDPKRPRQVEIEHFTNVQAIVESRCYPQSKRLYTRWTLYNFKETVSYFSQQVGEQLLLKIPRYTLWYDDLLSLYPNLILTLRLTFREEIGPWIYCYINVTARSVTAHIAGGHYREVSHRGWLFLDGSKSREPARSIRDAQQLTYSWILSSENGSDEKYLSSESLNSRLYVPITTLNQNSPNLITLRVTNKLVNARSNTATQVIQVVADRTPLSLDLVCLRNCDYNMFAVNYVLHLRAICHKCKNPIKYSWTFNGVDIHKYKQRLVTRLSANLGDELIVGVRITDLKATGYTELRLQKSKPPTGGECTIEPQVGFECSTEFHVHCQNFYTQLQRPLLYTFKLGSIYIENSYSGKISFYLSGGELLTVRICDLYFSCITKELSFVIEPSSNNATDTKFSNTNIPIKMLEDGRRQQLFCMLNKLAGQEKVSGLLQFFQSIQYDRTLSFLEMVNTLQIAYKCIHNIAPLKSYEAYVISYILERVLFTFDFVQRDAEILDMPEDICLELGTVITDIVKYCTETEKELLQQEVILVDFDDYIREEHSTWFPFDPIITLKIARYLKFVNLVFEIWRLIGAESSRYIRPEEPFNYVTNNVNYKLEMHENYAPIAYTSNGSHCTLNIPLSSVKGLRNHLQSNELLIHAWCFQTSIFWWVPEPRDITSAVLSVNVFGGKGTAPPMQTYLNQSYFLSLRHDDTKTIAFYNQSDKIYNNMIIYKLNLHGNVNLLVTFLNGTQSLRVLITMNVEPTLINLYNKNCYIPKGKRRSMILKNRCQRDGTVFIAVYKANSFDTSRAQYTFSLSAQECSVWGVRDDNPHWVRNGCYSQNTEQHPLYSKCNVNHLSTFSAKEYPMKPFPIQKKRKYVYNFPVNVKCLIFHSVLLLGTLALLYLSVLRLRDKMKSLIRVIRWDRDEVPPKTENIIVHISTGGKRGSMTTANVKLVFKSDLGRYKVVIYQNPMDPHLSLNSSRMLRLSGERVQLPCRLTISHDISGRYPNWYCRSIQVDDLQRDLSYTFPIRSWIRRAQKIRVSCYPTERDMVFKKRLHQVEESRTPWRKFITNFRHFTKLYYTNWFFMQPIMGPWRVSDDSCNLYERTCIWICKTILTVTMVFCFFRTSTYLNYYDYEQDLSLKDLGELFAIAIGTYFATIIFDIFLSHFTRA